MFSIHRFCAASGVLLLSPAAVWAATETLLWEPGKVVAVDQVSTPAKEPDPSCRAVPKGANPPARCRPSALAAEQFWRVTVEAGNKRYVVRPYRAPSVLDVLNPSAKIYVDAGLAAGSPVEVAVSSSKLIRLRTDQGPGTPAVVDSQELLANPAVPAEAAPVAAAPVAAAPVATPVQSGMRVILLEGGDFIDLEAQEPKSSEVGAGAVLYTFAGDASPARIRSGTPVFLVLSEAGAAAGNLELSRLQAGKGTREMVYSAAKKHSASALPVTVTPVSATVRKVSVPETLPPGEYVLLLENSSRAFLFATR